MQSLSLSALNDSQLAQVKYLFADEFFGTDAAAFVYEVDKRGTVVGRTAIQMKDQGQKTKRRSSGVMRVMTAQAEVNVTDEFIFNAHSSGALSALLAKSFSHSEVEEVHHG